LCPTIAADAEVIKLLFLQHSAGTPVHFVKPGAAACDMRVLQRAAYLVHALVLLSQCGAAGA
jgi:hypothetical protein